MELNDEDRIKMQMVEQIQKLTAMFAEYVSIMKFDAYEANLEFLFTEGEGRIRMTDTRFRVDPKDGKMKEIPADPKPTLNKRGAKSSSKDTPSVPKGPVPTDVVAELFKRLRLK